MSVGFNLLFFYFFSLFMHSYPVIPLVEQNYVSKYLYMEFIHWSNFKNSLSDFKLYAVHVLNLYNKFQRKKRNKLAWTLLW